MELGKWYGLYVTDYWCSHELLAFPLLSQDLSSASRSPSAPSNTQSHERSSAAFRVPEEEVGWPVPDASEQSR